MRERGEDGKEREVGRRGRWKGEREQTSIVVKLEFERKLSETIGMITGGSEEEILDVRVRNFVNLIKNIFNILAYS